MFEELQRFDHGGKKDMGEVPDGRGLWCACHSVMAAYIDRNLSRSPSNQQITIVEFEITKVD